jgi:hypothetical protein
VGCTSGSRGEVPGERKPVIGGGGEEEGEEEEDNNNCLRLSCLT